MRRFFTKRFSVAEVVGLLAVTVTGMALYAWAATAIPHTFVPDTAAKADEVNANFAALAAKADELEAKLQVLTNTVETCPPDAVRSGNACIDKFEASVWETTDAAVIARIQAGTVTLADLQGAGAIQRGIVSGPGRDFGTGCPDTGNGCKDFYAVSIPGVRPSAFITWFQAAAAARNAGKRLPTNAEWQTAAFGTPDGAPCVVTGFTQANTGTVGCVSDVGAFDMVGNVWELVADWVPRAGVCSTWTAFEDVICIVHNPSDTNPGTLTRGGAREGTSAGVFAWNALGDPTVWHGFVGFRGAR